ncbi:hypothetical protein BJX96DRAFT_67444 [Aspergillus floccosus]
MVHGSLRARRCITCKRRKVKCDERRPGCTRCKDLRIPCEGYDYPPVFVDETKRWSRRHKQASTTDQHQQRQCNTALHQTYSLRVLLPDEDSILKSHFLSRFFADEIGRSALLRILVQTVRDDTADSSLQHLCVKALTAGYYGIKNHDHTTYLKSVDVAVYASQKLRQASEQRNGCLRTETLISVLCLCIYENVVATESTTWLTNYDAVSKLIKFRGPSRHRSGIERDILSACQYMIIVNAGARRRHCFLSNPSWKAVLRKSHKERTGYLGLYDILSDVPGLLHDFDALKLNDLSDDVLTELRDRTANTVLALHRWRSNLPGTFSSAHAFPPAYSQDIAAALSLHHAALLHMEELTYSLSLPLVPTSAVSVDVAQSDPLQVGVNAARIGIKHSLASEIFHLASSSISQTNSFPGALFFILPLHVAAEHMDPETQESFALKAYMNTTIAESHGFNIGRYQFAEDVMGDANNSDVPFFFRDELEGMVMRRSSRSL